MLPYPDNAIAGFSQAGRLNDRAALHQTIVEGSLAASKLTGDSRVTARRWPTLGCM